MSVQYDVDGEIVVITIDRPERKNAVDLDTARELDRRFVEFDRDERLRIAILAGAGGTFCAGADLHALAEGEDATARMDMGDTGPMGPTRRILGKPVIAAVEGYAVAGGLELACWCDLRVAGRSAVFGVFCRDVGVPLVDGGTFRLPRLIGQSRALDMILTGRAVGAEEAKEFGLVNRVVDDGTALDAARKLAQEIADKPQRCLAGDRLSTLEQWGRDEASAMGNESRHGLETVRSDEPQRGAATFGRRKAPAWKPRD